jgi:pimeloyl-ACP methyl ester carboxylesterase
VVTLQTAHGESFVRRWESSATEAAVFVHGLGGESLEWADVAGLLADRCDWYAPDLPGFGESPPPSDGDLSIDAHVRAIVDVITMLDIGPVHLVGNSLGGAVATRLAAEHPDLVRSLALITPALPDLRPGPWNTQLLVALVPGLGPWLVRRNLLGDPEKLARRVIWFCYGNPTTLTSGRLTEELDAIRRRAALPHTVAVYRSSLRALVSTYLQVGRRRLWRQARLIDVPTLLIYGGKDRLVDSRLARRAQRAFRNSRIVLLPDAGHVPHLEFPEQVAEAVRRFLDDPPRSGMDGTRGTVEASD